MAIYALGDVEPKIHPDAFVHPQASVIGNVTIGADTSIWPHAVLRGDYGEIRIGARTSIQDGAVIHTTESAPTIIGDDCVIGHMAHLESCTVEDGSLVGTNAVILHFAVVGSGALVGASALVPNGTRIPPRALALGVPVKIKEDAVDPIEAIAPSAANYVMNARRFRTELRRLDGDQPLT